MAVEPESNDWSELFGGPNAKVWIHAKCTDEVEKLTDKQRAKIMACMQEFYCSLEEPALIPPKKLNRNEGRYGPKKDETLVQAFKHDQGRVYGVEGSISGKRTFFAAAADKKKQRKLDPRVIDKVERRMADLSKKVPGAKV